MWTSEFPDFPAADMPSIPETWEDVSWHNDVSPSFAVFRHGDEMVRVWIAESDPAAREYPEQQRFLITRENETTGHIVDMLIGDDWAAVLEMARNCALAYALITVNSAESATRFLKGLHHAGLLFHPDETAFDSLAHHDLGSPALMIINANMAACHVYLPDASAAALKLINGEELE